MRTLAFHRNWIRAAPMAIVYAVVWAILAEGDAASWLVGLPAVGLAVWLSAWDIVRPVRLWRLSAAVRFMAKFMGLSVVSGVDVAAKALHRRCPIKPGFHTFALRLPEGAARHFFVGLIGLLPGTLSARSHEGHLTVHVLDDNPEVMDGLRRVEAGVGRLFGLPPFSPGEERP